MATQETEITVEQKLQLLFELQQVDSKIDELRVLLGELPGEVKDMGDEVEGLKTRLVNIENEIKDLETQISEKRVQAENANAAVARYKEQQDNVRNNREYDNLTKEIEFQTLEIELCQKKIRDFNNALEARKEDKQKTITEIEERTVDLNEKKAELNGILNETREQTEMLILRSQKLEKQMTDERLLAAFKRIRKNARNGLAVVTVERDACGGCHNKIPAQRQLDIRLRKKVIVCEYCGRILIDPDMANDVRNEDQE
ncbi:MAG: C4-type zinc ribbon domain-containing protein [Paludibacter sp.]|nr:C4-type zinc ribbon domain-containing protein [Bacteroidales bacterium]MCM1068562.1 C4-type zinc ribbon domain-containing protein [Prevotella sp.]MCM1353226.1 C4-type zinc ribbon domain-containing protein [Bacteroides sp.]MCM1442366.1 C4-type zinc ribbon domain-containing protein [Muribaculum sp.]MCM1481185.1 C4-type zinc ribbon domain-containing protein [Paludibacter sp.]